MTPREEVRELMRKYLKPYVNEVEEDNLRSIIGVKEGKKNAPRVMLADHMGEIDLRARFD